MRERISKKTKEGMKKAKKAGKKIGRPGISKNKRDKIVEMAKSERYSVRSIGEITKTPPTVVQRVIKEAGDSVPPRRPGRRLGYTAPKKPRKSKKMLAASAVPPENEFI